MSKIGELKIGTRKISACFACVAWLTAFAACARSTAPASMQAAAGSQQAPLKPVAAASNAISAIKPLSLPLETDLTSSLKIRQLADGIWIHISTDEKGYPANGALVKTSNAVVLLDTTWTDADARTLLSWIKSDLHLTVTSAVVTHSHRDRSGGLAAVLELGIPVHVTSETAKRLPSEAGTRLKAHALAIGESFTSPEGYEVFFPGPGHTADNVVVWFPAQQVLFGGCLAKAKEADSLGFIGDANLAEWPAAVQRVEARYPNAKLMVPGHGEPSGVSALGHTVELLKVQQLSVSK